jgi:hypothetical protein
VEEDGTEVNEGEVETGVIEAVDAHVKTGVAVEIAMTGTKIGTGTKAGIATEIQAGIVTETKAGIVTGTQAGIVTADAAEDVDVTVQKPSSTKKTAHEATTSAGKRKTIGTIPEKGVLADVATPETIKTGIHVITIQSILIPTASVIWPGRTTVKKVEIPGNPARHREAVEAAVVDNPPVPPPKTFPAKTPWVRRKNHKNAPLAAVDPEAGDAVEGEAEDVNRNLNSRIISATRKNVRIKTISMTDKRGRVEAVAAAVAVAHLDAPGPTNEKTNGTKIVPRVLPTGDAGAAGTPARTVEPAVERKALIEIPGRPDPSRKTRLLSDGSTSSTTKIESLSSSTRRPLRIQWSIRRGLDLSASTLFPPRIAELPPLERQNRLGIYEVWTFEHFLDVFPGNDSDLHPFARISIRSLKSQFPGHKKPHPLVCEPRRRVETPHETHLLRTVSGFLQKFSIGTLFRRFVRLQSSRRNFENGTPHGVSKILDQNQAVFIEHRKNGNSAGMPHSLTFHCGPSNHTNPVPSQSDTMTSINLLQDFNDGRFGFLIGGRRHKLSPFHRRPTSEGLPRQASQITRLSASVDCA